MTGDIHYTGLAAAAKLNNEPAGPGVYPPGLTDRQTLSATMQAHVTRHRITAASIIPRLSFGTELHVVFLSKYSLQGWMCTPII